MDIVKYFEENNIDPNNQQNFFSILIKALMLELYGMMKIRGVPIPHMIMNTGDDTIYLMEKEHDFNVEPCEVSNEQYIYNIVPRGVVSLGSIDTAPDQLSNPYSRGIFQIEFDNQLHTLTGEFRRIPLKLAVTVKYIMDSFTDSLELCQHVVTKLAYIRTFKFVYMGQTLIASFKIPDGWQDEHQMELTGDTRESRNRTVELALEVESAIPVFAERTISEIKVLANPTFKNTLTIKDKSVN